MPDYPLMRCRFGCGKESTRPGWIVHTHEPECHLNPNRRAQSTHPVPRFPLVRCRFGCGKESRRAGWITHTHEPMCHLNPDRSGQTTPQPSRSAPVPRRITLERLRSRCKEYERTIEAMSKEQGRVKAELEQMRRELYARKGCPLCNTDLLPTAVREAVAQEVVKIVSQKQDVMQQLLNSVLLPTRQAAE